MEAGVSTGSANALWRPEDEKQDNMIFRMYLFIYPAYSGNPAREN